MRKLTTIEFIDRAKKLHEGRYDYSKVIYEGANNNVEIICPEHGVYLQSPSHHLSGQICPKCLLQQQTKQYELKFIELSRKQHKGRYDYSMVNYKGADTKVTIVCPMHGDFQQRPADHARGRGCRKCGNIKKSKKGNMGIDAFYKKAILKHGYQYDYSAVKFENTKTKVTISCPKHGPFSQTPDVHMRGHGCPLCRYIKSGKANAHTKAEFIKQANFVHDYLYDYSKVEYTNNTKTVTIICPDHGMFRQTPSSHIHQKSGCPECKKIRMQEHFRKSTEVFIKQAELVHDDKYDYSKVDYQTAIDPVIIICADHGPFMQLPASHLSGRGCRQCAIEKNADKCRMSEDIFINRCKDMHRNKYGYDLVNYRGLDKKVKIECPIHGVFEQLAGSHIAGRGCVYCQDSGFRLNKPAILYYLRVKYNSEDLWKIGVTNRTIEERFAGQDIDKITTVKIWKFEKGIEAYNLEQEILESHMPDLYCGTDKPLEAGNTELFTRDVLGLDSSEGPV